MLLVIDVGNTNITLGIFREEELVATFRLTTKQARTSDEYGVALCNLLEHRDIKIRDIHAVIIASVVPDIMYSLNSAVVKYLDRTPLVVGPGIRTGLKLPTENPREIGADRVVDCVAAYELYGGPVIVMDFGTATTYDVVTKDGAFIAGITALGIRSAGRTLWDDTAKLPEVEIKKPASILARETISSMQAGIVYGCIGQTEYIINQIIKETGYTDVVTVATGGLGKIIFDETDTIQIYDPDLTLHGLRLIYNKNR